MILSLVATAALSGGIVTVLGAQDTASGPEAEARAVVQATLDSVVAIINDPMLSEEVQREKIEEIAYGRFDFDTIGKLILARNWKKLSGDQRTDFITEFRRHLSLTYGNTLRDYKDEAVTLTRTRSSRKGDVTVLTEIASSAAEPYLIDYRLRNRGEGWRVIDVIVEGVSLISNFRAQTQEIISDVGPAGLIERLREKNNKREAKS